MTNQVGKRPLPLLPHPDHLRKQAKARLAEMKAKDAGARLADAQRSVAEEYGFSSWAALQAEVARRAGGPLGRRIRLRRSLVAFLQSQDLGPAGSQSSMELISLQPHCRRLRRPLPEPQDHSPLAFLQRGMVVQISVVVATLVGIGACTPSAPVINTEPHGSVYSGPRR
jgi:hypothetical protein